MISKLVIALFALIVAGPVLAQDVTRGQLLYERTCFSCHAESVHSRDRRAARDLVEVRSFVVRWSRLVNSGWSAEDVNDVVTFLNGRFYRFECDKHQCGPGQGDGRAANQPSSMAER